MSYLDKFARSMDSTHIPKEAQFLVRPLVQRTHVSQRERGEALAGRHVAGGPAMKCREMAEHRVLLGHSAG